MERTALYSEPRRYDLSSCDYLACCYWTQPALSCLHRAGSVEMMALLRAELLITWVWPTDPAEPSSLCKRAQLIWAQCSFCAA